MSSSRKRDSICGTMKVYMSKQKSTAKSKETQKQARSSEKNVNTYTFPEYGVSVRATDINHAKQLLRQRLKGE